ncbi:MAG: hypothetical protein V4718_00650 [Pseudomonadota bacterium]
MTSTHWLLLGLVAAMCIAASINWAGKFIDKYLDERSADGQHHKAKMHAIERQTAAIQKGNPLPQPEAIIRGPEKRVSQIGKSIQAHAVRTALKDFASGTTTVNPHAAGTLGNKQWQSHYNRVMHDQRHTSAAVQASV